MFFKKKLYIYRLYKNEFKNLKSTNLKSKDHTFIITDDVLIKYIEYLRNHYIFKGEEKEFKARIKGRKTYDEINRAFPESLLEAFIKSISTKSNEDNKSSQKY